MRGRDTIASSRSADAKARVGRAAKTSKTAAKSHPHPRAEELLAELKRAGLKLTPQRIAIVRTLADDHSHPTAQDLFDRLRGAFPTMSFATVYNTLDALANCGLTGSLNLGGAIRFDPNTSPHHHAVCDGCGAIVDIPAEPPAAETKRLVLEGADGFRVRTEERIFRGLCRGCSTPQ
ncbi:Peroxide stress regulator PerR, FUR family [Labilithrix luteola]|uniref:Peroxide stress regulator PerR, FUR family n=1 Tax=Labilithrix luteola TaxID=1391654 RepID=A0A0K1Q7N7_9BACT|nr:Fur family transcriptional regulator [Labilithrix luteola]AKV01753.1 Peroxide stress regulator PerR, FUR family [Labilithrix luteola]